MTVKQEVIRSMTGPVQVVFLKSTCRTRERRDRRPVLTSVLVEALSSYKVTALGSELPDFPAGAPSLALVLQVSTYNSGMNHLKNDDVSNSR